MTFKQIPDYELEQLTDEQLIAYVRAGRDDGQLPAARRGLHILVYGYEHEAGRSTEASKVRFC